MTRRRAEPGWRPDTIKPVEPETFVPDALIWMGTERVAKIIRCWRTDGVLLPPVLGKGIRAGWLEVVFGTGQRRMFELNRYEDGAYLQPKELH